MSNRVWW